MYMCVYMYYYIHTYIHTYIHACIHTCLPTYLHAQESRVPLCTGIIIFLVINSSSITIIMYY